MKKSTILSAIFAASLILTACSTAQETETSASSEEATTTTTEATTEATTTTTTETTPAVVTPSRIRFTYTDNVNHTVSHDTVTYITNLTTSNLDFRETEFEGNPASEYFCKAGQDVVITFDCDDELFLGGVYNGIDATYPLLENGAKLERDGKTYTLTVSSDVFKANDVLNYHYVELYAGTNTNDYVVSIAFVVDF